MGGNSQAKKMAEMTQNQGSCLIFPQIVKAVFQFLPARSICNAASVCKLWKRQADIVLQQRKQYSWQLFTSDTEENNGNSSDQHIVWDKIQDYFRNISFKPKSVLIFMTGNLWQSKPQKQGRRVEKRIKREECQNLRNNLPSSCQVMLTVSNGIIGTSFDMKQTMEVEEGESAAVFCIGSHPGIELVPCKTQDRADSYIENFIKTFDSSEDRSKQGLLNMKAVLLMPQCSLHDRKNACHKIQHPLLVGGIADHSHVHGPWLKDWQSFIYCQPESQSVEGSEPAGEHRYTDGAAPCRSDRNICSSNFLSQVLVCGEKVHVACVKFAYETETELQAERTVARLKEMSAGFPLQHSVAFMFACVARGEGYYGKDNVESAAFRKHFPNTPLLGFFGNGEIGCEYASGEARCENSSQPHYAHRLVHGYTTFIVLISFP